MTDIIKLKGGDENMCNAILCSDYPARNFLTKEEKIEILNDYKKDLELEMKGVEEKMKMIESGD